MARLANEKVCGNFLFKVDNFKIAWNKGVIDSPTFSLGGHLWQLHISPTLDDFVGFSLNHLSASPISASYSVSIENHLGMDDLVWVDPDGVIEFRETDHPDSSWGNEEFIALEELLDSSNGFISGGAIKIVIRLEVVGAESNLSYQADNTNSYDTQLVELIKNENTNAYDLMSYADADVSAIMGSTATNQHNDAIQHKQDALVDTALYTAAYKRYQRAKVY